MRAGHTGRMRVNRERLWKERLESKNSAENSPARSVDQQVDAMLAATSPPTTLLKHHLDTAATDEKRTNPFQTARPKQACHGHG